MRSLMKHFVLACAVLGFGAAALAADPPAAKEKDAEIPFANLGGIQDWQADGDYGLYIQGRSRKDWYYAKLFAPCIDLPWAERIGFVSEPTGTFDKFSSILVNHRECRVDSLVRSEAPPKKAKVKDKPALEKPNDAKAAN